MLNMFPSANKDLWLATYNGDVGEMRTALANGADIEHCRELFRYHSTPLGMASNRGDSSVVLYLLESGAKVNGIGGGQWTALHYAAQNGHVNILQLLLSHGANVNSKEEFGETPLDFASKHDQTASKMLLIRNGGQRST